MTRLALPLLAIALAACSGAGNQPPADAPSEAAPTAQASGDGAGAGAEIAELQSRYTSLKDCKTVEINEDEDWSVSRCAGLGGIALILNYGDARDDIALHRPGKPATEIGLPTLAGGGFNTLGDTVEWRGTASGAQFRPAALIVRNSAVQDPERPEQQTALLVVIDLAQGCAIAQIKPQSGQNDEARAIADGPRRPCLRS